MKVGDVIGSRQFQAYTYKVIFIQGEITCLIRLSTDVPIKNDTSGLCVLLRDLPANWLKNYILVEN